MMVLFALILALGRLVDDGIVIVENIYRHMSNGEPSMRATRLAVGEVTMPIIAATTATVMVFVPLLFWPGIMGEFMKFLPITFMIALGSSLFVALVVNPALASKFMKVEEDDLPMRRVWRLAGILAAVGTLIAVLGASAHSDACSASACSPSSSASWACSTPSGFVPATNWFQFHWLPAWRPATSGSCATPWTATTRAPSCFGTFGLLLLAFILLGVFPPKTLFFPENEPQYINAFIEAPIGTDILKTDSITRLVERR
jgi:multidrug efflux pump